MPLMSLVFRDIIFPHLPEKIAVSTGALFLNYKPIDLGEIQIPRGRMAMRVQWEGTLYGIGRSHFEFTRYGSSPLAIRDKLVAAQAMGRNGRGRLLLTGSWINMVAYLDKFDYVVQGGDEDLAYQIEFVEVRQFRLSNEQDAREDVEVTTTSPYVLTVAGDTLWRLAARYLGSTGLWREIRALNLTLSTFGADEELAPGLIVQMPVSQR